MSKKPKGITLRLVNRHSVVIEDQETPIYKNPPSQISIGASTAANIFFGPAVNPDYQYLLKVTPYGIYSWSNHPLINSGYDTMNMLNPYGFWHARFATNYKGIHHTPLMIEENKDFKSILLGDSGFHLGEVNFATEPSEEGWKQERQIIQLKTTGLLHYSTNPVVKAVFKKIGFDISYIQSAIELQDGQKINKSKDFWEWWVKGHDLNPGEYAGKPLIDFEKIFYDHHHKLELPATKYNTEQLSFSSGLQTAYVDNVSEYNFFINQYEKTITDFVNGNAPPGAMPGEQENLIPNMYMFLSEQKYLDNNTLFYDEGEFSKYHLDEAGPLTVLSTPYSNFLTLGGRIKNVLMDVMIDKGSINVAGPIDKVYKVSGEEGSPDKIKIGEKDIGDYWLKFATTLNEVAVDKSATEQQIITNFENWTTDYMDMLRDIGFLNYDSSVFEDAESKKHLFPMHNKIEFTTDVVSGMADVLQETKLMYSFMNWVKNNIKQFPFPMLSVEQEDIYSLNLFDPSSKIKILPSAPKYSRGVHIKDFIDMLEKGLSGDTVYENVFTLDNSGKPVVPNSSGGMTIGTPGTIFPIGSKEELFFPHNNNKFMLALLLFKFKSIYKKYVEARRRSHEDIMKGVPAHSETIFYRIEKKHPLNKGLIQSDGVIQNIYIPNSSNSNIAKYYDTSVAYGKEYIYNVYAYVLVVGNKYQYLKDETSADTKIDTSQECKALSICNHYHMAETMVNNSLSVMLLEVPYAPKLSNTILDSPPIQPDVDIVPYRGVDNKLKLNFNSNTGRVFTKPIWFNDQEKIKIDNIKKAQKVEPSTPLNKDTVIMFESDDPVKKYEIYKISPPETDDHIMSVPGMFQSYKPKKYLDFGQPYNVLEDMDSWIDYNIRPNKKYYYMFRAVDEHGHFSNPSAIYEVQIINDSGAVYPLIKTIELEKPMLKTVLKPFRKYLQIIPNFEQGIIQDIEQMKTDDPSSAFKHYPQLGNIFSKDSDGDNDAVRKFKIRITSKSTGKKIDFNVRFVQSHDESKELEMKIKPKGEE